MKKKPSQFRMKCHRNMENAVSVGTFGEKKCASTMQFVPRHTEIRHRRNRKPKCLLFNCWLDEPYKKCEMCRKACAEVDRK